MPKSSNRDELSDAEEAADPGVWSGSGYWNKGKLVSAVRHNFNDGTSEFRATETYNYNIGATH